jgi:CheY-like chemotaxis protein
MSTFKKVLFVDDDAITITIYQRTMRVSNFCDEVVSCSNGQQAKDYLLEHANALPQIIFLDINMHVMTGWEFLIWFEKWAAVLKIDIPVYMLSSSLSLEDADKSKKYKLVRGYITKPITVEHLKIIAKTDSLST